MSEQEYIQTLHQLIMDDFIDGEYDRYRDFGAVAKLFGELAIPYDVVTFGKAGAGMHKWSDLKNVGIVFPPTAEDPEKCTVMSFTARFRFDQVYTENWSPLMGDGR